MNNIWRSEAEAKPSNVRSECALMSKKYIGNRLGSCRCQLSHHVRHTEPGHCMFGKSACQCLRDLFYSRRGTVCRGDWAWLVLINVTVTRSVFHWAWDHLTQCARSSYLLLINLTTITNCSCDSNLPSHPFHRQLRSNTLCSSTQLINIIPYLSSVIRDRTLVTELNLTLIKK